MAAALGHKLAEWTETLPAEHSYRTLLKEIQFHFGGLGDFESILRDLMASPPHPGKSEWDVLRPYKRTELAEAIRESFDFIRQQPADLYQGLARMLHPGDAVITFNYDLGIERALQRKGVWQLTNGYGFPIQDDEPSQVNIYKLHGSTNWHALLFQGRMGGPFAISFDSHGRLSSLGDRPVLPCRPDLDYLGLPDFVDPRYPNGAPASQLPVMILPALPKTFDSETSFGREWEFLWDGLWAAAKSVLEAASEVFLIGYSLPQIDETSLSSPLPETNRSSHGWSH